MRHASGALQRAGKGGGTWGKIGYCRAQQAPSSSPGVSNHYTVFEIRIALRREHLNSVLIRRSLTEGATRAIGSVIEYRRDSVYRVRGKAKDDLSKGKNLKRDWK